MPLIHSKVALLQSINPEATIRYSYNKKKIFIITPPKKTHKPTEPCCICLENEPTHYLNCRCVRKHPIICNKCLNTRIFVQTSKCPNCRSWFSESATTPFSPDQIYNENTRPKKELLPWQQKKLNKSLVHVLTKTRSGPRMKELIEQGADIHYENGEAVLYAALNGHYQIFDFLVNYLDYKTIFSLDFHKKIVDTALHNRGSNKLPFMDLLLSINTDEW